MRQAFMSAADFRSWQAAVGLSNREVARRLGVSPNSPGRWRRDGAPLDTALACSAIAAGLEPWRPETAQRLAALSRLSEALAVETARLAGKSPTRGG
jgi:hypothetical protein